VLGVHSPEFPRERDPANVARAIERHGIPYPVAQDDELATWHAYRNRYWPTLYFVDAEGVLRGSRIGEGGYEESERRIRALLAEVRVGRANPEEPEANAEPVAPFSEAESRALLAALSGPTGSAARAALDRVVTTRDRRFVAVLIELLRAAEVGIASPAVATASAEALGTLTGQGFGTSWPAWVEWYAGTDLTPPPGFTGWKGELLARIDPHFGELLRESAPSRARVEEIVWGGVAYEGIPALDRPKTIPAAEADFLADDEPVFGVALGGEARAYPLRILDWHELANDVVGGVPFSLAYCTLCGSGIAWAGRTPDGRTLDFGSSGLLMRSNKLMVDRQTRTLWNQLTGRPVHGELAASDLRLELLPSVVATWGDWRAQHPETDVLSLETGYARPYHPGAAYAGYFASDDTLFPVRERLRRLPKKARVYGLDVGGVPKAYPLDALLRERVVDDEVGDMRVVVVALHPAIRVDGVSVRSGPASYEAGAEVRAYAAGDRHFAASGSDGIVDAEGRPWRLTEEALLGPEGERAERLPGTLVYWFGWSAYFPKTLVYEDEVRSDVPDTATLPGSTLPPPR
jgi:hypothetical protein